MNSCGFVLFGLARLCRLPHAHLREPVLFPADLNKLIGKQTQLGAQMNENVVVKEVRVLHRFGLGWAASDVLFELVPARASLSRLIMQAYR